MIGIKGKERPIEIRFWEKVQKSGGCWNWIGAIDSVGYGSIRINGKTFRAHVLSYQFRFGSIPQGLYVCHSCDNRRCVNPDHLFLGTAQENTQDMMIKGRNNPPRGISAPGHKLTEAQVMEIRARHQQGESTRKIAKDYPVCHSVIWQIVVNRKWKHL